METGSGVGFAFTGLTPTNNPVLAVPEVRAAVLMAGGLIALPLFERRNVRGAQLLRR